MGLLDHTFVTKGRPSYTLVPLNFTTANLNATVIRAICAVNLPVVSSTETTTTIIIIIIIYLNIYLFIY